MTISGVIQYLFDTYGDVTIEELKQMRTRMEGLTFTPSEPVDSIFTEIDSYAKMCALAGAPLSHLVRSVTLGICICSNYSSTSLH